MRKDLAKLSPQEKFRLAEELRADAEAHITEIDDPDWFDGKKIDEVAYCEHLLAKQEMRCINHRIYTMDGLIEDDKLRGRIAEDLKPYVRTYLDKAVERVLSTLKLLCVSEPIRPTADRVHFRNGTYYLDGNFCNQREWTMNRLPVDYNPEAAEPKKWISFLAELMHEDDIITLQEFLGYTMIATNKGQSMLLIIGSGGEGKSRISAVMQELFGNNMNIGNICKMESDKFAPANQEGKLLFIDDDMKMEALASTNVIKAIVTCDGKMDLERKNKQSYQGMMYVRMIGLGNGTLKALHDKTNGFYRRQIIIQTKDKPVSRVDDPFLKEKLEAELDGILLWCLEGLHRLVANRYKFTVSERSKLLKQEFMEDDNNIKGFLTSTGYIAFDPSERCTTKKLYDVYRKWCYDNAEKPMAASTFSKYLAGHEKELHIKRNKNIPFEGTKYARGYEGIKTLTDGFAPIVDNSDNPFV
ncbi:MAG: phage/plasmid primase, P4 family [Eubacteriales bacterium]|nr:phage/plasmid primase, P4 family [Eubacteriales bacterium]